MKFNQTNKILYIATIILFTSCNLNSKKNTLSKVEYKDNQNSLEEIELKITIETTDILCQVASFLDSNNFNGDFYVNNGNIKWCMGVESIEIPGLAPY